MLARDWLNTYYLEDTGLFRVSLGDGLPSLGQARRIHELRSAIYLLFVLQQELEMCDT